MAKITDKEINELDEIVKEKLKTSKYELNEKDTEAYKLGIRDIINTNTGEEVGKISYHPSKKISVQLEKDKKELKPIFKEIEENSDVRLRF